MRCVVEYENGDLGEFIVGGFAATAVDDVINEMPRTVRAWIYMDEWGEKWDPDSEPDWEKWETERWYRFYGPAGSGVIRLPWLPVDEWKEMVARDFPLTYAATDTWDLEALDAPYRGDTVCDTDEELAEAIAGPSAAKKKAPARRKTASKNPSRKGGNMRKTTSAKRTATKRTTAKRKTTGARR